MMKRTIFFTAALLTAFTLASCDSKPTTSNHGIADIGQDEWAQGEGSYGGDKVYVCTGGSSKRYHRTKRCKGLESCKGKIKKVEQALAEDKGRTPCKMCYKQ